MNLADEEVIVVASRDSRGDVPPCPPRGCVEVIVEGVPDDDPPVSPPDALEDIEPMPPVQKAVLAAVGALVVAGIGVLVAYWNGLLG